MGRNRTGRHSGGEHERDVLSDAAAERLLAAAWALNQRSDGKSGPGATNGTKLGKPSSLPGFDVSAVAPDTSRMPYSADWDGVGDPKGSAGARGYADVPDPAAASGTRRSDQPAGSADNGGETSVSSVDIPSDLASPDVQAVARLLAAAAAPPRPHELRGYEAARRAFERAGTTPIRHSSAPPLRRLIGVKAAAVAGALTVTGVAVAAAADVLPAPIQKVAHQVLGGVGVPNPSRSGGQPLATGSSTGSSSTAPGTPRPTSGGPTGGAAPGDRSSSVGGWGSVPGTPTGTVGAPGQSTAAEFDALALCRAYAAQQAGTEGALSGHDRQRLAALAGGENMIADFCARTLAAAPSAPAPDPGSSTGAPNPSRDRGKPSSTGPASPDFSANPPSSPGDSGSGQTRSHAATPSPSHPTH